MVRCVREFRISGIHTTLPADLAILTHPDFAAGEHSTKWVEDRLDLSGVAATPAPPGDDPTAEPKVRRDLDVEVNGRRFSVSLYVPESAAAPAGGAAGRPGRPKRAGASSGAAAAGSGSVTVPMQGTIVKVLVEAGQPVEAGATVCVLEAMKMENNITADKSGTVREVKVVPGDSVGAGDVVAVIE
jgi:acetyl-CoA/propionyl-CoA carboxylase biotin carboxyl carrier protein